MKVNTVIRTLLLTTVQSSSGIFRYPTLSRWIVVVAKSKYIEELRKAPEDELSASEAMSEVCLWFLSDMNLQ